MKLYPKNMSAPKAVKITETDSATKDAVKSLIKEFVKEPTEYCAIIAHIEKSISLGKIVDIKAIIDEVRDEWHPIKPEDLDNGKVK